eukprot:scaffold163745_cov19-Prasinocladus_malaysianus.AAC.1
MPSLLLTNQVGVLFVSPGAHTAEPSQGGRGGWGRREARNVACVAWWPGVPLGTPGTHQGRGEVILGQWAVGPASSFHLSGLRI